MLQGSCYCGSVQWQFHGMPESATACNCTACRRYGVLWAYDYEGEGIHVSGATKAYVRGDSLGFHFCPECGCVAYWRSLEPNKEGRRRMAVNLRLTEPEPIAHLPIDHSMDWTNGRTCHGTDDVSEISGFSRPASRRAVLTRPTGRMTYFSENGFPMGEFLRLGLGPVIIKVLPSSVRGRGG